MATERYLLCKECGDRRSASRLFDTLRDFATAEPPACSACMVPLTLHLRFPFGLDASDSEFTMLDCFAPPKREQWKNRHGHRVTFWPFLVILKRRGRKRAVWLPYWHVVQQQRREKRKYGQWAPCMDERLFESLLDQARAKGYISA